MLRHGESTFNALGKFTGTTDVPLTDKGREQALGAGKLLAGTAPDAAFTSERIRAIDTCTIVLQELKSHLVPVQDHRLNEQDFGDLEGIEKSEAIKLFGEERVLEWRRAFHAHPPKGERFIAVQARVKLFYDECVKPLLLQNQTVLVVAHGNSLRALAIFLLDLHLSEIATFELGNAEPFVLDFSATHHTFTLKNADQNDSGRF